MNHRQRTASGLVAATITGALVLGIAPAASATDTASAAERAAAVVERATGTGELAPTVDGTAVTEGQAGRVSVTVPGTSDGTVEATAADGTTVALGLPQPRTSPASGPAPALSSTPTPPRPPT
ncbi:hypothetical protein [Streptomyces sp. NRRL WC-3742]|uniref:hypothetical protein n=1 Tax=Streptomyces sp. NRRL WC-3742 TaxID=1463934 RepID=UPI0004C7B283|nr:hypothetical protein [Streptomyces sp. NRRL WC-3742]